jgi:hypothetical protein
MEDEPGADDPAPATRRGAMPDNSVRRDTELLKTFLLLALVPSASLFAKDYYLFAYFVEPAKSGIYYAISADGYHWDTVHKGQPFLTPQHEGELMRDIFITRGPDRKFHAVWTWGWRERKIGYAESDDLVRWSAQREVPLMENVPGTIHTWAPEIYWDTDQKKWMIIWSSIAQGATRNRIYSSFTNDFQTFTAPQVFFDPGYDVIDATVLHAKSSYYLIFKDQTKEPLTYKLRLAKGKTLEGPWNNISNTFTESWSEGPSALKIGRYYFVYYDHYRSVPGYETIRSEAVRSTDLQHWTAINDLISFPHGCKHGSFLKISRDEALRLQ